MEFCTFFVVVLQVQLIKDKEREVRQGWCFISPRLLNLSQVLGSKGSCAAVSHYSIVLEGISFYDVSHKGSTKN